MMSGVLYLSYDGMLEPLGQSQVVAYLEKLAGARRVHLLSFEKAADWSDEERVAAMRARLEAAGIHWHPRRYHKHPSALATTWDISVGIISGVWIVLRHRLRVVHARSYVPGVMALALKRLLGRRFLFDMRGFWVDERIDGGLWPRHGAMYRMGKCIERRLLLAADHVVTLTRASLRDLQQIDYLKQRMPPVTVITTCADLSRFRPVDRPSDGFTLGYVGSVGTWYLFDEVVRAFCELRLRVPEAIFLIVNRNDHGLIRRALSVAGVPVDAVELVSADHGDVPALMARMTAGIFFIRPVFSKRASAPTKLAEFLGCGVPCLANAGVGDVAEFLSETRTGVAVDGFDRTHLADGVDRLLDVVSDPDVRGRCVQAALDHFSLKKGVHSYREVYAALDQA